MLIVSRKKNETMVIDDVIFVTVVEIRGDKVRLGFQMPKEIPLHRQEIYDAVVRERSVEPKPAPPPATPDDTAQTIGRLEESIEQQRRTIERQEELIRGIESLLQKHFG
jgi:carbon storage regulator